MLALDAHPHAKAVLSAALKDEPAHAYLLHGPAGCGKREAARALRRRAPRPGRERPRERQDARRPRRPPRPHVGRALRRPRDAAKRRRRGGRRRRLAHAVRGAHRIFVLERVDTLIEQAANALLKTLEEPPSYVVLMLLTDQPSQVLPTIASRCQPVRFDAPTTDALAQRLQSQGVPADPRDAAARLSLGDGEKALALALGDGPALRDAAEHLARAPLHGRARERPWRAILDRAEREGADGQGGGRARAQGGAPVPPEEGAQAARDRVHRARPPSGAARAHAGARPRAPARPACGTATSPASRRRRPSSCLSLRPHASPPGGQRPRPRDPPRARRRSSTTRAPALILNVSEVLACEALAYRLEEALSSSSSSA